MTCMYHCILQSSAFSDFNVRLADELNAPSSIEALQVNYCFIALSSGAFVVVCEDSPTDLKGMRVLGRHNVSNGVKRQFCTTKG